MKGVEDAELDFKKKLITLTVSSKAAVGPAEISEALPGRYKVTKIEISGLVGKVGDGKTGVELTAKEASDLKFVLVEGKKDGKVIDGIKKDLKALYTVAGEARIVEEKVSGKTVKVLKLFITSAKKVEKKK